MIGPWRRRLYRRALAEYQRGGMHAVHGRMPDPSRPERVTRDWRAAQIAYRAGHAAEVPAVPSLPVEVWALVLAEAQRP